MVYSHGLVGLWPKIVVPTRTRSLPALIAASKSALIPILSNNLPPSPHLFSAYKDLSSFSNKFPVARSLSKSGLISVLEWEASCDPIVISPRRWSRGHDVRMWVARARSSVDSGSAVSESIWSASSGGRPDLEASPDVLT